MIKQLKIVNFVKHKNRIFDFEKGLNTITGANETGKSLILEAINFAIHGSAALRLPASTYDNKTEVCLTLVVRGQDFEIRRTLKNATLISNGEEIAKSTSVVNKQVAKLLGYGFDVYQVANMASQGEIRYLSALKPAERKRMIDKTLGLTATKNVIEKHNVILRNLISSIKTLESVKPKQVEIEGGFKVEDEENLKLEKTKMVVELAEVTEFKHNLQERKRQREGLIQKQTHIVIPTVGADVPDGITTEAINDFKSKLEDLKYKTDSIQKLAKQLFDYKKQEEVKLERVIKTIEDLKVKIGDYTLEQLEKDLNHASLAKVKKSVLNQGGLTCKDCGSYNHFGADELAKIPEWVDEDFKLPNNLTRLDFENLDALAEKKQSIEKTISELSSEFAEKEKLFAVELKKLDTFKGENSDLVVNHQEYSAALKAIPEREKALMEINLLEKQISEMEIVKEETLNDLELKQTDLDNKIKFVENILNQIGNFKNYLISLDDFNKRIEDTLAEVELEKKVIETLNILLNSIRNNMLPKINLVASTWLRKLSMGLHSEVILDDNMEILVDDLPIDAYSGSGKSIAHIALRLSLAQILTKGVFPVFLADEVDADMDKERSEATLNSFKEMLQISTEQIILISHQDLNLKLDSDNAIQL